MDVLTAVGARLAARRADQWRANCGKVVGRLGRLVRSRRRLCRWRQRRPTSAPSAHQRLGRCCVAARVGGAPGNGDFRPRL